MLSIVGLHQAYDHNTVIKDLNLTIEDGMVLGLLGPNGSGKTTLLKTVAGVLEYNEGQVYLDNKTLSHKSKERIAFLPENNHLYDFMTVQEILDLYKIHFEDFDYQRFQELLAVKEEELSLKMSDFSKGWWQCFRLALVLARRARLYLLDEPLSGLDIIERDRLVEMIRQCMDIESSILVTSHLVTDIEVLLDQVAFIKEGQICCYGDSDALREQYSLSIADIYKEVIPNV